MGYIWIYDTFLVKSHTRSGFKASFNDNSIEWYDQDVVFSMEDDVWIQAHVVLMVEDVERMPCMITNTNRTYMDEEGK